MSSGHPLGEAIGLTPVEADLFYVSTDPLMRFAFERDGSGRVIALEQRPAYGPGQRQRRE